MRTGKLRELREQGAKGLPEIDLEGVARQVRDQVREYIDIRKRFEPEPRKDPTASAAALLAGIGIGAAAMYLLDPERGPQRRAVVSENLNRARERAGQAMEQARQAREGGGEAGGETGSAFGTAGGDLGTMGGATTGDAWDTGTVGTAGTEMRDLGGTAGGWAQSGAADLDTTAATSDESGTSAGATGTTATGATGTSAFEGPAYQEQEDTTIPRDS